jgi:hypothetical protein
LLDGLSMPQCCGDCAEVLRAFEVPADSNHQSPLMSLPDYPPTHAGQAEPTQCPRPVPGLGAILPTVSG